MSADIYTKSFKDKASWDQAQRLINIFDPAELTPECLQAWMGQRRQLANVPAADIDDRAGWSKAGARKDRAKAKTADAAACVVSASRNIATQTRLW